MKGILPISINTVFWSLVGGLRYLADTIERRRQSTSLSASQLANALPTVAVCLPAHNEEMVIANAIASLQQLVPPRQIYVVSDGSTDQTANLARRLGCTVLELNPGLGKAKALQKVITYFRLLERYRYLLIADADTIFDHNFLRHALPLFNHQKRVAVVAAYTKTRWLPRQRYSARLLFVAYRLRLYSFIQPFIMYGQTWHRTNVNPVIPGFACLYRTDILRQLTLSVPGVIIEDFNMAFQLHKKRLGTIAHHPSVIASTQDPDNFTDYRRQVLRWNLGFFQTISYWGVWPSVFWLSLSVSIIETLIFSLLLFILPAILLLVPIYHLLQRLWIINLPWLTWFSAHWNYFLIAYLVLLLTDYVITLFISLKEKEDQLAVYGLAFILLRYIDAATFLYAFKQSLSTKSSGVWSPPLRRAQ